MKKITLLVAFLLSFVGYAQPLSLESFESGTFPPTGWQIFNNGVGTPGNNWTTFTVPATYPVCGLSTVTPKTAYINRDTNVPTAQSSEDWLVTKQVDLTGITFAQLRFINRMTLPGVNGSIYKIYIKTGTAPTSIADFGSTPFAQWTEDDFFDGTVDSNPGVSPFNSCFEKILSLNTYANQQIYIAFVMEVPAGVGGGDRWVLDDVKVEEVCFDPTGLAVSATTVNSGTITFTPNSGETAWEYYIVPTGGAAPTTSSAGVVFTGGSPKVINKLNDNITDLSSDTNYQVYIRANCISGSKSAWVGPVAFKTRKYGENCSIPITVSTLPYLTNDNTSTYVNDYSGSAGACGAAGNYLNGNDVVYKFVAPFSGNINIRMTPASNVDTNSGIFVYGACPIAPGGCLAGASGTNFLPRLIQYFNVTLGNTYYIVISTSGSPMSISYELFIEQAFCQTPGGLTIPAGTITENSATINWTAIAGATEYQVAIQPTGSGSVPVATPTILATGITTNTYTTPTTLTQNTSYDVFVRVACGDGSYSPWTPIAVSFETKCGTFVTPYFEGFNINSISKKCWTITDQNADNNKWDTNYTQTFYEGDRCASIKTANGVAHNDWLISPKVDVSTNKRLRFRYRVNNGTSAFSIKLSTTGTNPADFTEVLLPNATYSNTEYLEKIVYLNNYTGVVYVAFHVTSGTGTTSTSRLLIDAVNFEDIPPCPDPLLPTVSNITTNGADFDWTSGFQETAWDVVIQLPSDPAPIASTVGIPANGVATGGPSSHQATGLLNGTVYHYYVRANCGINKSQWIGPVQFKTLLCNAIDKCNYKFTMTDTGGNGWEGNTMNVVQNGDIIATIGGTFTTGAGPVNINVALCPGYPFSLVWNNGGTNPEQVAITVFDSYNEEVYVKNAGTGLQGTTLHTSTVTCSPPACFKPQSLTCPTASVTSTTALIGWTEVGTATQWEIFVQPQGTSAIIPDASTVGQGTSTGTPPGPIHTQEIGNGVVPPLTPATLYEFWVRSICSSTSKSTWKGPFKFTTKPINDDCINAINVNISPNQQCTNAITGSLIGATASSQVLGGCNGVADDDVWYKFTATEESLFVNIYNTDPTNFDINFIVYSGSCTGLNFVYCHNSNANNSGLVSGLTVGQTYYIRAYTLGSAAANTNFNLCVMSLGSLGAGCFDTSVSSPNLILNAGAAGQTDWGVVCTSGQSVDLTGTYYQINQTTSYSVASIPYLPPFPFNDASATPLVITQDDIWSPIVNLGFNFCFYGNVYSSCQVGSNGVLTFNPQTAPGTCAWSFPATPLPSATFPIRNAIYGVYQDINPAVANPTATKSINYKVFGTAPCRTLVFNVVEIPQFSCGMSVGSQTSQMVLYEGSNIIDVYIEKRTPCTTWNGGRGVVGVQNNDGTLATIAPNRGPDTLNWTATSEAWRFTPSGPPLPVSLKWYSSTTPSDSASFVEIANSLNTTVTPTQTTTYRAEACYTICDNTTRCVTKDIEIRLSYAAQSGNPVDLHVCGNTSTAPYTFDLSQNNALVMGAIPPGEVVIAYFDNLSDAQNNIVANQLPLSYSTSTNQTIYVRISSTTNACSAIKQFNLVIDSFTANQPANITQCSAPFDLTQQNSTILGTLNPTDYTIVYYETLTDAQNGTNPITTANSYNGTATTIYVRIAPTANLSCYSIFNFNLIIQPVATVSISASPTTICAGSSSTVTITGTAGASVTYTDGTTPVTFVMGASGTHTITHPSTLGTLTYTLQSVTYNSCTQPLSGTATVTVVTMPTASLVTTNTTICAGSPINVDFTGTPGAVVTYNDGSGNQTVTLDGSGNYSLAHSGGTKTYSLVSVSLGTCSQSLTGSVTITVNPIPTASISASPTTICSGSSSTVTITGTAGASVTYTNGTTPVTFVMGTSGTHTITHPSTLGTLTYTLQNVSLNGCSQSLSGTATVTVNPMPDVTISGTNGVCFGQSSVVTFTGTIGATVTYTVNGGANQTITIGTSGNATLTHSGTTATYALVSVAQNGCSKAVSGSAIITIGNELLVGLKGDCIAGKFTISATPLNPTSGSPIYSYSWLNPSLAPVGTNSPMLEADQTGIYTATITRLSDNCSASATFMVDNISCSIQKGISPNGDGKNDSFDLRGLNVSHLTIYNRYGKQVYTRFNYRDEWSGQTNEGNDLPDGTYYYMIERTNGESLTGWVYINRSN